MIDLIVNELKNLIIVLGNEDIKLIYISLYYLFYDIVIHLCPLVNFYTIQSHLYIHLQGKNVPIIYRNAIKYYIIKEITSKFADAYLYDNLLTKQKATKSQIVVDCIIFISGLGAQISNFQIECYLAYGYVFLQLHKSL